MVRLPDLVRDSKLETRFAPDFSVETVHTYHESEPARRRLVSISEHWKREGKVGGGGYSTVWVERCGKVSRHGIQVRAVKQIETGGRFARIDFNRELEAIAKFSHPKYERCFVKSFGWYNTPQNLFITMEYLKLGDLHDYLLDKPPLSEIQAQDISYQILEGLHMMHENEFMHRDLKPKNILIKSHPPQQEWWVKIADFGISKRMEESPETSTTLRGTTGFIAPELYGFIDRGSLYSPDIWSLGEVIFQILTKRPAFKPIGQLSLYARQPEMFPSLALSDAGVTEIGIEFVRSLMCPEPGGRLTTETALKHAWMQPPNSRLNLDRFYQRCYEPPDFLTNPYQRAAYFNRLPADAANGKPNSRPNLDPYPRPYEPPKFPTNPDPRADCLNPRLANPANEIPNSRLNLINSYPRRYNEQPEFPFDCFEHPACGNLEFQEIENPNETTLIYEGGYQAPNIIVRQGTSFTMTSKNARLDQERPFHRSHRGFHQQELIEQYPKSSNVDPNQDMFWKWSHFREDHSEPSYSSSQFPNFPGPCSKRNRLWPQFVPTQMYNEVDQVPDDRAGIGKRSVRSSGLNVQPSLSHLRNRNVAIRGPKKKGTKGCYEDEIFIPQKRPRNRDRVS